MSDPLITDIDRSKNLRLPAEMQEFAEQLAEYLDSKQRPTLLPAPIPVSCGGISVDFQTYTAGITTGPLVVHKNSPNKKITFTDNDLSGPVPTDTRIEIFDGRFALHCGFLMVIDLPPGIHRVSLLYFNSGGVIDVFDLVGNQKLSKLVSNSDVPTTATLSASGYEIRRIEIRSANEMYLLHVCCR